MRESPRRTGRTWLEAARVVLESHHNTPMSRNDILKVILKEKLKDISGNSQSSLNTLSAMLYSNSRTLGGIFYKLPGRPGVYKLKKFAPHRRRGKSEGHGTRETLLTRRSKFSPARSPGGQSSTPFQRHRAGARTLPARQGSLRLVLRRGGSRARSPPAHGAKTAPPARAASASQQHCRRALKQALKQQRGTQSRRLSAKTLVLQYSLKKSLDVQATQPGDRSRPEEDSMDVDTPHSLLVNTELKALINVHTFAALPADFRKKLLSQLPPLDKEVKAGVEQPSSTALNNEFINVALAEWTHRLAEGAFTAEMQLRLKQEKERKVEAWKEEFFEDYYGQKSGFSEEEVALLMEKDDRDPSGVGSVAALRSAAVPAVPAAAETSGPDKGAATAAARPQSSRPSAVCSRRRTLARGAPAAEPCPPLSPAVRVAAPREKKQAKQLGAGKGGGSGGGGGVECDGVDAAPLSQASPSQACRLGGEDCASEKTRAGSAGGPPCIKSRDLPWQKAGVQSAKSGPSGKRENSEEGRISRCCAENTDSDEAAAAQGNQHRVPFAADASANSQPLTPSAAMQKGASSESLLKCAAPAAIRAEVSPAVKKQGQGRCTRKCKARRSSQSKRKRLRSEADLVPEEGDNSDVADDAEPAGAYAGQAFFRLWEPLHSIPVVYFSPYYFGEQLLPLVHERESCPTRVGHHKDWCCRKNQSDPCLFPDKGKVGWFGNQGSAIHEHTFGKLPWSGLLQEPELSTVKKSALSSPGHRNSAVMTGNENSKSFPAPKPDTSHCPSGGGGGQPCESFTQPRDKRFPECNFFQALLQVDLKINDKSPSPTRRASANARHVCDPATCGNDGGFEAAGYRGGPSARQRGAAAAMAVVGEHRKPVESSPPFWLQHGGRSPDGTAAAHGDDTAWCATVTSIPICGSPLSDPRMALSVGGLPLACVAATAGRSPPPAAQTPGRQLPGRCLARAAVGGGGSVARVPCPPAGSTKALAVAAQPDVGHTAACREKCGTRGAKLFVGCPVSQ
ncbi:uncharacterized protein LOC116946480 isoform X2 [Petromyzon marinus]|uniref:uncharacterized protein LOC116946480 isoform X2 n=1 Tax=Petromyzon marinus TaxID=7757 RepID=UPI003F70360F